MAHAFASFLVLFVAFATCSAKSIHIPAFDDSVYSADTIPDHSNSAYGFHYSPQVNAVRSMIAGSADFGNEAPRNSFLPVFSTSPSILQAMATADAISEIASAKTARAKAGAEARKISLHVSATQEAIKKIQVEADQRSRSAAFHAARANSAEERRRQALAQERDEFSAAKRDEAYANYLKRAVFNAFTAVKQEELRSRELISQLQREADDHESRAKYFLMKADNIASSAGLHSLSIPAGLVPDSNSYNSENDYLNSFNF